MSSAENYVFHIEVGWALLDGSIMTIPKYAERVLGQIDGRNLRRKENEDITLILDGKAYNATIRSVDSKDRKNDTLQISYKADLTNAFQTLFNKSYTFIKNEREARRNSDDRSIIRLPDTEKEYVVFYTTESDNTYVIETILAEDLAAVSQYVQNQTEQIVEAEMNADILDPTAAIAVREGIVKVRKLNRKIGEYLKQIYSNRCQICGKSVGDEYGEKISEVHHIEYFTQSQNNDMSNLMVLCPNHHRIIHAAKPKFDQKLHKFTYANGFSETLNLNKHL